MKTLPIILALALLSGCATAPKPPAKPQVLQAVPPKPSAPLTVQFTPGDFFIVGQRDKDGKLTSVIAEDVEIGLRSDGVLVWRKKK